MRRFTQFILVSCLLMLCSQMSWAEFKNFSVQVNNQAGTLLTAAEQVQGGLQDAGKTYTNEPFSVVYAMNDKNNPGTYTSGIRLRRRHNNRRCKRHYD